MTLASYIATCPIRQRYMHNTLLSLSLSLSLSSLAHLFPQDTLVRSVSITWTHSLNPNLPLLSKQPKKKEVSRFSRPILFRIVECCWLWLARSLPASVWLCMWHTRLCSSVADCASVNASKKLLIPWETIQVHQFDLTTDIYSRRRLRRTGPTAYHKNGFGIFKTFLNNIYSFSHHPTLP